MNSGNNIDNEVVKDFGNEWKSFTQKDLSKNDLDLGIKSYFRIFPYEKINQDSVGADFGCGSGRWVPALAPYVKKIICIDPSEAIDVAKENHKNSFTNLEFEKAGISENSIKENSLDIKDSYWSYVRRCNILLFVFLYISKLMKSQFYNTSNQVILYYVYNKNQIFS